MNSIDGFQDTDFVVGRYSLARSSDDDALSPISRTDRDNTVELRVHATAIAHERANWTAALKSSITAATAAVSRLGGASSFAELSDDAKLAAVLATSFVASLDKYAFVAPTAVSRVTLAPTPAPGKATFATATFSLDYNSTKSALATVPLLTPTNVRVAVDTALVRQLGCAAGTVPRTCASMRTVPCAALSVPYDSKTCCPTCDLKAVNIQTAPDRIAPKMTFSFGIEAALRANTSRGERSKIDPTSIKFSLGARGVKLRSRDAALPSSLAIRFSVDVLGAPPRALTPNLRYAASDNATLSRDASRFALDSDEVAILLGEADDGPQVVLTWATKATVRGCQTPGDTVDVQVSLFRSLLDFGAIDGAADELDLPGTLSIKTHVYYASIDLSRCTRDPDTIDIDPNLSVVTEGESDTQPANQDGVGLVGSPGATSPGVEKTGLVEGNHGQSHDTNMEMVDPADGPAGVSDTTLGIIVGCSVGGGLVFLIGLAAFIARSRSNSKAKAGLA